MEHSLSRENILWFLLWNNLGIALGCGRCVRVCSVGWAELKNLCFESGKKRRCPGCCSAGSVPAVQYMRSGTRNKSGNRETIPFLWSCLKQHLWHLTMSHQQRWSCSSQFCWWQQFGEGKMLGEVFSSLVPLYGCARVSFGSWFPTKTIAAD